MFISRNLFLFLSVSSLEQALKQIGTNKDSSQMRNRLWAAFIQNYYNATIFTASWPFRVTVSVLL